MVTIGSEVGASLPPCGSSVTITTSTPVHVGDPRLRLTVAVGDEQRRHRFDLPFAFDPGLEHLVRGQLVHAGELQRPAVAFLDHLHVDPADLAFDGGGAVAAVEPPLPTS